MSQQVQGHTDISNLYPTTLRAECDIMEFSSYLQAIQKVAGESAGKKYQTLNYLARKIISDSKDLNSIEVYPSESLPDPLIPLVKLEIARILKKPEGVVDALKSEDQLVFERALKIKWFFNGSVENYPNVHHFQSHILPYISLKHRIKIIKVLANSLAPTQPTIAEEFYQNLCETYGHVQAHPLLKACSESFIWDNIIKRQLVLKLKKVIYLFLKYPNLILKYLKLGISNHDPYSRNIHVVALSEYQQFFPMLLKKYSRNLVELILAENNNFDIQLNSHHTDIFLRNEVDELIKNPKLFLPMLKLETVTRKLSRAQFEIMYQRLFTQNIDEFDFCDQYRYLLFMPDEQRMTLLLNTFKKVYNKNLLECNNLIIYEVLQCLSDEDRVKQARYKLETDKDWSLSLIEESWRCYLPTEESIPMIKAEISKRQDANDRVALLKQLFYTCKVNIDYDALLEVLKYISTRHKNEQSWTLDQIFKTLLTSYNWQYVSGGHWNLIFNFVKSLHVKNQLKGNVNNVLRLLTAGIHSDLLNNQSVTEKLNLYTELNLLKRSYKPNWNIIRETPSYERKCLEEFAKVIPEIYSKLMNKESHSWPRIVNDFTESIYYFNKRNRKSTDKLNNLSIKNYSWLLDNIRELVNDKSEENFYLKDLRSILKIYEEDLYNLWIPDDEKPFEVLYYECLTFLKNDPKKIIDHYSIYYERFCRLVDQKSGQLFLKNCRWCQDLPEKFVEMSVNNIIENEDHQAVLILSGLLEGPAFEKFIAPYAPKSSVVNIEGDNPRKDFILESSIPRALNLVNPPVSLDFILSFCEGDYIHIIINCLMNVGKRVAVNKLLPFCNELMSRRVSVKKHGIRLFRLIATTNQLRNTLMNLWREEKHRSIRLLIVKTLIDVVNKKPCLENMSMINECLDSLTVDDRDTLPIITNIDKIPDEFVVEYFKKLLIVIKKIGDYEDDFGPQGVWNYTQELLKNLPVNVAILFPEELHEEILKTYLIDISLPERIIAAAQSYLVTCYIKPAKDKLDSRLKIFSSMFERIITDHLITSSDDQNYPGNFFVTNLAITIVHKIDHCPDKMKFIQTALDIFCSISKPQWAPQFYCDLSFTTLYNDKISPKEFAAKICQILPLLVDNFSVGFMPSIAYFLRDLIEHFYCEIKDDAILDVIEFLLQVNDEHAIVLGTSLLLCGGKTFNDRFCNLLNILRQHKNPLVVASANTTINKPNINLLLTAAFD